MSAISNLFSHEMGYAMGWTIIHSLWQCTLIALVVAISYAFTKKASPATRYWINVAGLLSCLMVSGVTFYINYQHPVDIAFSHTNDVIDTTPSIQTTYLQTLSDIINKQINHISILWLTGFAIYISKYMADFFYCQHIKNNHYEKPHAQLQQLFYELAGSVGITRPIQLRISNIIDVPCVIGHLKPVVLLPASLVLGLTIKQLEVILLHELGHVRRNDYLISSMQTFIAVLYFFNPCARWIASKIDEERENACDDIAVSVSGNALFYANTLKEFAEMNTNQSPTIAITGRKNLLISRIKRLFIRDTSFSKTYGKAITLMAIFLTMIGYSVTGHSEEKTPVDDAFVVTLEQQPLSILLKLAEDYCPTIKGHIHLKHPDQTISGNFPDLKCNTVEYVIRRMDNSLAGITIDEHSITLKDLQAKAESQCPELKDKIKLKNPEKIVGFSAESLLCTGVESVLQRMDTEQAGTSTKIGKIDNITFGHREPDKYNTAFIKGIDFPKENVGPGFSGDCTTTFTVDANGAAQNISPVCISPTPEQKQYFEQLINSKTKTTKFPIQMTDGKAVPATGISVHVVWKTEVDR